MRDARIHDGDVLVVDRAEEPRHGSIVIASIDNEFTVKQLQLRPYPCLMPLNPAFPPIRFDPEALQIWGITLKHPQTVRVIWPDFRPVPHSPDPLSGCIALFSQCFHDLVDSIHHQICLNI